MERAKVTPTFKSTVDSLDKDIHEIKMYLRYERRADELISYKNRNIMIDIFRLFHEHENHTEENFRTLLELKANMEKIFSLLLDKDSAKVVFEKSDEFKPLFYTISNPELAKDMDAREFLENEDFHKVIWAVSADYKILSQSLVREGYNFISIDSENSVDTIQKEESLTLRQKLLIILFLQDFNYFIPPNPHLDIKPYHELLAALFDKTNYKDISKTLQKAEAYKSSKSLSSQQKRECIKTLTIILPYFKNIGRFEIVKEIENRIDSLK